MEFKGGCLSDYEMKRSAVLCALMYAKAYAEAERISQEAKQKIYSALFRKELLMSFIVIAGSILKDMTENHHFWTFTVVSLLISLIILALTSFICRFNCGLWPRFKR